MTPELTSFLTGWLDKAGKRQISKGVQSNLSLDEFVELFGPRRIKAMEKLLVEGKLYMRMNRNNQYAYVLTWKSRAAAQGRVFNFQTAQVCTRQKSEFDNRMKKGDEHRPDSKARIAAARTGTTHSAEVKDRIGDAVSKSWEDPASKAARRLNMAEAARRRWATKRGESL